MRAEDVASDRQAETDATGLAVARRFAAMERLECTHQFGRRDARAIVLNLDGQGAIGGRIRRTRALPPYFTALDTRLANARFIPKGRARRLKWAGPS